MANTNNKLPKIQELYNDTELAVKNDVLTTLLNQEPKAEWVKEHPYIKGHKYIPIDKIEYLLRKIFKQHIRIEVCKTGLLLNCVEVTVRVHFKDIVSGEWSYHDGVGACEIQTKSGTGHLLMDMSNINRGAIQMALPIAKTYAIKDACDHFGKLFGSDLNRKDVMQYGLDKVLQENAHHEEDTRVLSFVNKCESLDELDMLTDTLPTEVQDRLSAQIAEKAKELSLVND